MVTSAHVPGADKIAGRIVFNMGCHGGLNIPDLLSGDAARKKDWVDSYLQSKNAVYIANTGFGYGDTVTVALTERLLKLFGEKLNSANTSIGEQWVDTLQTYYLTAGDYDVFDEKAMIEATFYGLPFYHFRVPGTTTPPTPPTTTPENGLDVGGPAADRTEPGRAHAPRRAGVLGHRPPHPEHPVPPGHAAPGQRRSPSRASPRAASSSARCGRTTSRT